MQLRCARNDDVPALQGLLRASWLTTWAPQLAAETVARFHSTDPAGTYATEKWPEFVVAENGGQMLGMSHVEGEHLHALHLDPAHKRRGIRSVMMDAVEAGIAKAHSQASLEVLAFNTGAIAFYEQRGWRLGRRYFTEECGEPVDTFEMFKVFGGR